MIPRNARQRQRQYLCKITIPLVMLRQERNAANRLCSIHKATGFGKMLRELRGKVPGGAWRASGVLAKCPDNFGFLAKCLVRAFLAKSPESVWAWAPCQNPRRPGDFAQIQGGLGTLPKSDAVWGLCQNPRRSGDFAFARIRGGLGPLPKSEAVLALCQNPMRSGAFAKIRSCLGPLPKFEAV